jgi:hypothetical protein
MIMRERPMTEALWRHLGGLFIPEYPLVQRGPGQGRRCADAVILPCPTPKQIRPEDMPSIIGRRVTVVQTKATPLGMNVMGQALFSARLAWIAGAKSVRSIVLCPSSDAALEPLLAEFPELELWLCDANMVVRPVRQTTRRRTA